MAASCSSCLVRSLRCFASSKKRLQLQTDQVCHRHPKSGGWGVQWGTVSHFCLNFNYCWLMAPPCLHLAHPISFARAPHFLRSAVCRGGEGEGQTIGTHSQPAEPLPEPSADFCPHSEPEKKHFNALSPPAQGLPGSATSLVGVLTAPGATSEPQPDTHGKGEEINKIIFACFFFSLVDKRGSWRHLSSHHGITRGTEARGEATRPSRS